MREVATDHRCSTVGVGHSRAFPQTVTPIPHPTHESLIPGVVALTLLRTTGARRTAISSTAAWPWQGLPSSLKLYGRAGATLLWQIAIARICACAKLRSLLRRSTRLRHCAQLRSPGVGGICSCVGMQSPWQLQRFVPLPRPQNIKFQVCSWHSPC